MAKQLQWVMVAVPAVKRLLAGKKYTEQTGNPADDDSFTMGYFDSVGNEYGVACWTIDKTTVAQFDALIAAYPEAKVSKWLDGESAPEEQLAALDLSRSAVEVDPAKRGDLLRSDPLGEMM